MYGYCKEKLHDFHYWGLKGLISTGHMGPDPVTLVQLKPNENKVLVFIIVTVSNQSGSVLTFFC